VYVFLLLLLQPRLLTVCSFIRHSLARCFCCTDTDDEQIRSALEEARARISELDADDVRLRSWLRCAAKLAWCASCGSSTNSLSPLCSE